MILDRTNDIEAAEGGDGAWHDSDGGVDGKVAYDDDGSRDVGGHIDFDRVEEIKRLNKRVSSVS